MMHNAMQSPRGRGLLSDEVLRRAISFPTPLVPDNDHLAAQLREIGDRVDAAIDGGIKRMNAAVESAIGTMQTKMQAMLSSPGADGSRGDEAVGCGDRQEPRDGEASDGDGTDGK